MGISSTQNRIMYQCDGTTASFSFPYYFSTQTDLNVYLWDSITGNIAQQTLNGNPSTGFTISGSANSAGLYTQGANVVFNSSPVATAVAIIVRSPAQVQNLAIPYTGIISSASVVNEFDYLMLLIQRLEDQVARAITVPDGMGSSFSTTLPGNTPMSANALIQVNSNATGIGFALSQGAFGGPGLVYTGNGSSTPATFQPLTLSGGVQASSIIGVLSTVNGGTGQASFTSNGVFVASGAHTITFIAPSAGNQFLLSGSGGAQASFQPFAATFINSGTVGVAFGGTGLNANGTANQLFGTNSGATGFESKSATMTAAGQLTIPSGQQLLIANGTVTAPGLAFSGSGMTNAGMYITGSNAWALSVGGALALSAGLSTGGFGNIGFGGISASLSDSFPFFVSRSIVGGTIFRIDNPDTTAASNTKIQVYADNDNNQMEIGAFTAATAAPDVYAGGRGTVRATGSLTGISLIADSTTSSDIRLYSGGDAITNRIATANSGGFFVGVAGSLTGLLNLCGATSGTVTIQTQATAGTWNFNLPTSAGGAGQVLTSQGGGSTAMTWTNVSVTNSTSVKNANYNAVANDAFIEVQSSGFTVNLYGASGNSGKTITITKIDNTAGNIVIAGSNASINGTSYVLSQAHESISLFCDGSNWQIDSLIKQPTVSYLSTLGNGTYVPPTGCVAFQVEVIGGGGAGGSCTSGSTACGGGGGGGGYTMKWINNAGSSYPYVIGVGAPSPSSGNVGGISGSSSIFGSSVLSTALIGGGGGGGGGSNTNGTNVFASSFGAGGAGSGGDIFRKGGNGQPGITLSASQFMGGEGGESMISPGGAPVQGGGAGNNAPNYGGGGSGAAGTTSAQSGGSGAQGVIIVTEFYG